jgi:hypothetical protein
MQRMVLGMLSDCLSNLSESRKRVFLFPGIGTSHQTGPRTRNQCQITYCESISSLQKERKLS